MPNFKMIQQNYEFALIDVTKEQKTAEEQITDQLKHKADIMASIHILDGAALIAAQKQIRVWQIY